MDESKTMVKRSERTRQTKRSEKTKLKEKNNADLDGQTRFFKRRKAHTHTRTHARTEQAARTGTCTQGRTTKPTPPKEG